MALCRFEAKIISRSGGRSTVGAASYRTGKCATSAAAYRAGAELTDERTGMTFDYTRKRGVMGAEIMLPTGAPQWMRDRGQLWNAVEKAEKRADAQLARDHVLTLPHELSDDQRRTLTREFVRQQFVDKGYVADIAWHAPHGKGDERNFHAHVMVVMRRIDGNGFARTKERPPDGKHPAEHWKAELRAQREAWANAGADALDRAGLHLAAVRFRAGHLTLDKQREAAIARGDHVWAETLDREAEPKQGPLATKIEREGRESHAGNDRRAAKARNAEFAELKAESARIEAEIIDLATQRARRGEKMTSEIPTATAGDDALVAEAKETADRKHDLYTRAQQIMRDEMQAKERLRQEAETIEREKAEAKKREKDMEERQTAQIDAGDIVDPQARRLIAIAKCSNLKDPFETMANAAMKEFAIFHEQQQALRDEAAKEKDPEQRKLIELNRQIQAHEYVANNYDNLAGMVRNLSGRDDNIDAIRDDHNHDRHTEEAQRLRGERADLQKELRQREIDKVHSIVEGGIAHMGQPGGRMTDNTSPTPTAADRWAAASSGRRATVETEGAGRDETDKQKVVRRQAEETTRREGLRADQPTETAPPTKDGREIANRDPAAAAWARASAGLPSEAKPDGKEPAGRPTGKGGKGR